MDSAPLAATTLVLLWQIAQRAVYAMAEYVGKAYPILAMQFTAKALMIVVKAVDVKKVCAYRAIV